MSHVRFYREPREQRQEIKLTKNIGQTWDEMTS